MFDTPISQASVAAMALACICALIMGKWPERAAAVTLAINWVGCEALEDRRYTHHPFHHLKVQPAIATIDIGYAAVLIVLLMTTRRHWLMPAVGLQLLIVGLHAVTFLDVRISHYDFFTAYFIASWGVVAAMVSGAAIEGRRGWRLNPETPTR